MTNFKFFRWIKENVPDWAQAVVASPDEGAEKARADPNYAFIWNTITMPNQGGCEFLEVRIFMHRQHLSVIAIDRYRLQNISIQNNCELYLKE